MAGHLAILFDLDDTLFDRKRAQHLMLDAITTGMPDVFVGMNREHVSRAFADSDRIALREHDVGALTSGDFRSRRIALFLELLGLDCAPASAILDMYVAKYATLDAPVQNAKTIVRALADDYSLGIVSDGFSDMQYSKLDTMGIRQCFRCVVLSEDVGVSKPDPRVFTRAASLLGVHPRFCLHVGDRVDRDIVGAKHAGMRACWFNPERIVVGAQDCPADAEIHDLAEIPTVLQSIARRPGS